MKIRNYITIAISITSLILSIYAAFVCDKRIEADWMGILVGILALLTTILLGWQLFSLFNIQELKQEIKDIRNEAYVKTEQSLIEFHGVTASTIAAQLKNDFDNELFINYTLNCLHMIIHLHNVGQYERCEANIKSLIEKYESIPQIEVQLKYQAGLTALVTKVAYLQNIYCCREALKILTVVKYH